MADLPVPKRKKKSSVLSVTVNDGLHFHAILLLPPRSRLKVTVEEHFDVHSTKYLGDRKLIDRIDFQPILTESSEKVTDYVFKATRRGLSYDDHILIFPKALSEMEA
jgi:hypothetical protein